MNCGVMLYYCITIKSGSGRILDFLQHFEILHVLNADQNYDFSAPNEPFCDALLQLSVISTFSMGFQLILDILQHFEILAKAVRVPPYVFGPFWTPTKTMIFLPQMTCCVMFYYCITIISGLGGILDILQHFEILHVLN